MTTPPAAMPKAAGLESTRLDSTRFESTQLEHTDIGRTATTSAVLITASEPEPRSFGKQVVIGGLLDHLCARLGPDNVHVVLLGKDRPRPNTPYRLHLINAPRSIEQLRSVVRRVPLPPYSTLQEAALWSPRILRELRQLLVEIGADLEIWDTMRTGQYAVELPRRRRALYADDLFSKRYATMLDQLREDPANLTNPLGAFATMLPSIAGRIVTNPWICRWLLSFEQRRSERSEDRSPAQFDATILVNPRETAELRERIGSTTVHTLLPLLPDVRRRPRRYDGSATFVFVGGLDFPPNRDGLTWFLRTCREPVLSAMPDFRLLLVGRGTDSPPPEAEPWGDHVRPLGWVDDLDDVLMSVAGMLSPLRIGSGIKIKVLEALARGLPVIATPHGVLGLDVDSDDGCLVAENPADLAGLLAEATDPARNEELSRAAAQCWRRSYAPDAAGSAYDELLGLPEGRR